MALRAEHSCAGEYLQSKRVPTLQAELSHCPSEAVSSGLAQSELSPPLHPREEEDREVAAAIRASVAAQQQEETQRVEDREEGSRPKKEEAAARAPEEPRGHRRLPRAQGEGSGNQSQLMVLCLGLGKVANS